MLFLATWEPRFKAIVATSTGISDPTQEAPLSPEASKAKYDQLVAAAKAEREGRAKADIKTLQAWVSTAAGRMRSASKGSLRLL